MKTEYKTLSLLVKIDGEGKSYEFPAVSIDSALTDIRAAVFGTVELVWCQWENR